MKASTTTTTPVIHQKSMLVHLSFNIGRQGGRHDECTTELCEAREADKEFLTANMKFLPPEAHEPMKKLKNMLTSDSELGRILTPWGIASVFVCKAKFFPTFLETWNTYLAVFEILKAEYVGKHAHWKALAKAGLGTAFIEAKFPTVEQMNAECNWSYRPFPIPEAELLRRVNDLDETIIQDAINQETANVQKRLKKNEQDLYKKMAAPLMSMIKALSSDKPSVKESLITGIISMSDNMEALNITDDPNLTALAAAAKQLVKDMDREEIKNSPILRQQKVDEANAMLKAFGKAGARKFAA